MPRLLLINPNTTTSITERLAFCARERLGAGFQIDAMTAGFGASYISSEAALAVAQHAVVDTFERFVRDGKRADAVLIGCFGDPGLHALQELANCPVIGLAQASMQAAAAGGGFAIVTGGAAWKQPLERLAFAIGLYAHWCGIETVEASGAQLAADPDAAHRILLPACRAALRLQGAQRQSPQSVIVGGAGLLGIAQTLAVHVPVPLLDSVHCGVDAVARSLLRLSASKPTPAV